MKKIKFLFYMMTGCGACEIVKPVIAQLQADFAKEERVEFETANTSDDNWARATRAGVSSVPTVQLYLDDELLEFAEGPMPRSAYQAMLRRQLGKIEETKLHVERLQRAKAGV